MKLARKLVFAFTTAIFAVLTIYGWLRVERESALFETDMKRDAHTMGRALEIAVADVWREDGPERALALVEAANDRASLRIRWVWLDAQEDDVNHPRVAVAELLHPISRGEEVVIVDRKGDGKLLTYVPVDVPGDRIGALEIGESLAQQKAYLRDTIISSIIATVALVTVCGISALALGVWFVGRPIHALIEQARRIGAGDLSRRLSLGQRDEVGELAQEMNAMCDRLDEANSRLAAESLEKIAALEQLRHAERLATIGKLASGIAHELGTPLNVVAVRGKMIARGEALGGEVVDNARIIVEQSERMTTIIRQLLDFARRKGPQKSSRDLQPIAAQTLALLEPLAQKSGVALRLTTEEPRPRAEVDDGQLQQALTNLVINAIHAMPRGGELAVSIYVAHTKPLASRSTPPNGYVCVSVRDQGTGMSAEVREHIFEPFFTTKPTGEGTGLGLSVTYGIVQEHGGLIEVESSPTGGSQFTMYFPRSESS